MFTKTEFKHLDKITLPEILRCNLSSVCLQLLALDIHAKIFDFMDKPPKESIDLAFDQLKLLQAIEHVNERVKLTELGRKMAQFPLDPRYSKILLESKEFNCTEEILTIISVLSSESITVSPSSKREQAIATRQKFSSPYGDHITLLNIFRGFNNAAQKKHWCFENFMNFRNLNHAKEIRSQLAEICQRCNIPLVSCGSHLEQIRKCLITGLFMNVAELHKNHGHGSQFVTVSS